MSRWEITLGVAGSVAAAATLALVLDWSALLASMAKLSAGALLGAGSTSIFVIVLLSLRWATLTAPPTVSGTSHAFRLALVAQSFNAVTPGAFGGDAYRVLMAGSTGGRPRAAGLVFIERLLGLGGFGLMYLFAYALASLVATPPLVFTLAAWGFAGVATLPLWVFLVGRFSGWVEWLASPRLRWIAGAANAIIIVMPTRLLLAFALTLAGAVGWLACITILAHGAGVRLTPETIAMIAITTEFARLLPISIQGLGVREAVFAWLATEAGGEAEPAAIACMTAYALHFGLSAVLALMDRSLGALTSKAKASADTGSQRLGNGG